MGLEQRGKYKRRGGDPDIEFKYVASFEGWVICIEREL